MSADLRATVDKIFVHLSNLGRSVSKERRAGLSSAMVRRRFGSLGLTCPNDLDQLYQHCDGTNSEVGESLDQIQFFPGYYWMSLDEATETYLSLVKDVRWSKEWFPILADGGGDFYAAVCNESSNDFGGIVGFIAGESDHLVEFKNVATFFSTIEQSFAEKAFYVASGFLEADFQKMRAIANSIQSGFVEHEATPHIEGRRH